MKRLSNKDGLDVKHLGGEDEPYFVIRWICSLPLLLLCLVVVGIGYVLERLRK